MRWRVAFLVVLLLAAPVAAGSAERHGVDVVAGDGIRVRERLAGVGSLDLPVPSDAAVEAVTVDGDPAAWTRRGDRLHAPDPGNYTVVYRVRAGPVDLVRPAPYDTANLSLSADVPARWTVEPVGVDAVRRSDGRLDAWATNVSAGTETGMRIVPPATPSTGLVPFVALLLVGLAGAGGVAVWRLRSPEPAEMGFWGHYRELRHRMILTLVPLVLAFFAFFMFRLDPAVVGGFEILVPALSEHGGMAAQAFRFLQSFVLPTSVELIVTNPVDAITAEILVGLFLAVVATSPIAAYHAARFLGPALYPQERRTVLRTVPLVTLLFLAGCLFALGLIVPFAFEFLYAYGSALGAITFVTAQEFIAFTVLLVVAFGLAFELPVAMVGLSAVGVTADFWVDNWRIAAVAIFVFGAFITPDGSGVTMFIVALPLLALYGLGILLVRRRERAAGPGVGAGGS